MHLKNHLFNNQIGFCMGVQISLGFLSSPLLLHKQKAYSSTSLETVANSFSQSVCHFFLSPSMLWYHWLRESTKHQVSQCVRNLSLVSSQGGPQLCCWCLFMTSCLWHYRVETPGIPLTTIMDKEGNITTIINGTLSWFGHQEQQNRLHRIWSFL